MSRTYSIFQKPWLTLTISLIALFYSHTSLAHVRWFIADGTNPDITLPYDTISLAIAIGTLTLFMFATAISYIPILPNKFKAGLTQPIVSAYPWMWYTLILVINCYLAVNLLLGEFLAPNLYLSPQVAIFGVLIQTAAIVLMAISVSLTGAAIVITSLGLFLFFPFFIALDYVFEFLFVGLALIFIGPSLNNNDSKFCLSLRQHKAAWRKIAVHLVRIGLGLQLLELGIHNKLMLPGMALAFIDQNDYYNFFPLLNLVQISNLHFVFFVGISEIILGLLLITNLANRIIYGLLLTIFIITFVLSGLEELVGHMPIFTILVILFFETKTPILTKKPLLRSIEAKKT
ncbi:hypothetical protein [uncultured Photobacterium sp.]|uniref:hypothetical protein n=1 Tax=uncultured Photobacterium sp. TaxID=173973 RepID=UPI00261603E8|nr:hypothetical protein [uncultured Photobacterium sp.]